MKKKIFACLFVLFCAFAICGFASCQKHTHVYDREKIAMKYLANAATCTESAACYYSCRCGKVGTDIFSYGNPKGHTEVIDPAVEPTKAEDGLTEGRHCSTCNVVFVKQQVIPAIGSQGLAFDGNTLIGIGDCSDAEIYIPEYTPGGAVVEKIGNSAFMNNKSVTYVKIPNGVKEIDSGAFLGCLALENVSFGKNVSVIAEWAFFGCSALSRVEIPDNVTEVADNAFNGCSSLSEVVFGAGVASIGDFAFYRCADLTEIVIPDCVKTIGNGAFYGCEGLVRVELGNGTSEIGETAFYNCKSLLSVTLGKSVTEIGNQAFQWCYKLVEVINLSALDIAAESEGFGGLCDGVLNVKTVGESDIVAKDGFYFYVHNGKNYLLGYDGEEVDLKLPKDFNGEKYEIYRYAFYNRSDIESVSLSVGVSGIGDFAFYGCSRLGIVDLPSGLEFIGIQSFGSCADLACINYGGTTEQWLAVSKNSSWNADCGDYLVVCSDGSVNE